LLAFLIKTPEIPLSNKEFRYGEDKTMFRRFLITSAVMVTVVGAALLVMDAPSESFLATRPPSAVAMSKAICGISALGRLEPAGEVVKLSATIPGQTPRVESLLVKEGGRVRKGQVVAILDGYKRLQAAVGQAEAQVGLARAHLAQIKAGAKAGDIEAQKALIARLEAEYDHASTEYNRFESLHSQGAVSTSQRDAKKVAAAALADQLLQARSQLESLKEVRVTDVHYAEAEVESGLAAVARARAEMETALVLAPRHGQILKVFAKPGEMVGNDGIAELGETAQMYAVAEVYETDVERLLRGQPALITSDAFSGKLQGVVDAIGHKIGRKAVLDPDPAYDVDQRVVEVKIRLSKRDSLRVCGFTNLRVHVHLDEAVSVRSAGSLRL
jgi:HlyD family secretion protein